MKVLDSIAALRQARQALPGRLGLVPTMGYLHEGHLSLIEAAREDCDHCIVTIFVNPTQFAQNEDLASYPRDLPRDLSLLEAAGVDLVFTPTPDQIYPPDYQTYVTVQKLSEDREGAVRPGHFQGVATVVAKLFNLCQPDIAYFGQKDAQQVAVIRQMRRDLNFPLSISVCPILREEDGLAMSSRNVYLGPEERILARALHRALEAAAERYDHGERDGDVIREIARAELERDARLHADYASVADAATLAEVSGTSDAPLLVSLAAQVGRPRLLDNMLLPRSLNTREGASAVLGAGHTLNQPT